MIALLFLAPSFALAAAENEEPSIQDLSQTQAASFYFSKQHPEALAAFQELERQYPKNVIIKRYIAVLLDAQGRREEAEAKLREIVALDPGDPIAKKKLERAEKIKAHAFKNISAEKFVQSAPAQAFAKGRYKEALAGLETLKTEYPEDVLIRRYAALAMLRLKKTDQAVRALTEALEVEPENTALHYTLAEAYRRKGQEHLARQEFRYVMQHDEAGYKQKAHEALFRQGKPAKPSKRWGASLSTGCEFDTNATFKSRDADFREANDQNSIRYPLTTTGYYRFFRTAKWTYTADAFYSQNVYQDINRLNTYTSGGGVSALYGFRLLGRQSFLSLREGVSHTFLKNKYYTGSNNLSGSLIHDLNPRVRLATTYRFTVNQFESKGSDPGLTRRDGLEHSASLNATYYFNPKRTFYTTVGYAYEHDHAHGINFVKHAHETSFKVAFPLVEKVSGNMDFRFRDSDYPGYAFTAPPRRDKLFYFSTSLSRPILPGVDLVGRYAYENSLGRNNLYEYNRHIFSVLLALKF